MEPNAWLVWIAGAQVAVTVFIGLVAWHRDRSSARKKDLESLMEAILSIGDRVTKLESSTISHTDLGEVYDTMNTGFRQVSKMDGKMDALVRAVDRIQEYLFNNGGKQ